MCKICVGTALSNCENVIYYLSKLVDKDPSSVHKYYNRKYKTLFAVLFFFFIYITFSVRFYLNVRTVMHLL